MDSSKSLDQMIETALKPVRVQLNALALRVAARTAEFAEIHPLIKKDGSLAHPALAGVEGILAAAKQVRNSAQGLIEGDGSIDPQAVADKATELNAQRKKSGLRPLPLNEAIRQVSGLKPQQQTPSPLDNVFAESPELATLARESMRPRPSATPSWQKPIIPTWRESRRD